MGKFVVYRTLGKRDKDPVIKKVADVLKAEGLFEKRTLLHDISGNATSTFNGWFDGVTISPQHRTIMNVITGLGYDIQFVKVKEVDVEKEREVAREFFKERAKREGRTSDRKAKRAKARRGSKTTRRYANGHASSMHA